MDKRLIFGISILFILGWTAYYFIMRYAGEPVIESIQGGFITTLLIMAITIGANKLTN